MILIFSGVLRYLPARRVPVETLTVYLKHGKTMNEFLEDFPSVEHKQAEAFLEIAEKTLLEKQNASTA